MSEEAVRSHLRAVVGRIDDEALPPHYPTCLGCGPDAVQGYHLQVRREGDEVVAEHVFEERHGGAPGIAHGGAVATVVDDVLGFLLYVAKQPGVTRKLEVEYLKPVLLGVRYVVRGKVDRVDGRKLWFSCECTTRRRRDLPRHGPVPRRAAGALRAGHDVGRGPRADRALRATAAVGARAG